jgi:hypothetical protein
MTKSRRIVSWVLAVCVTGTGFMQTAQATLIGTEQVARAEAQRTQTADHARALELLQRAEVADALAARGVDVQAARDRVASLTDDEASRLAYALDHAPAGGDVLGTIIFIFVLLLITDILGFTRIFPFTRPIR